MANTDGSQTAGLLT